MAQQQQQNQSQTARRPKGKMSSINTNLFHLRNPYMIAWLSFTYPGFGHISMGSYISGFLLFLWEMLVNTQGHINLAILYTFTGRYEMAKEVVDNTWFLFYAPVFMFAVWDSYRRAIKFNQFSVLADRANEIVEPVYFSDLDINVLDKRSPWVAVVWSTIAPGLGHLYTHRIPTGFFLLLWWIIIAYKSCLLQAVQFTALGLFVEAKSVVDPEWICFIPSIIPFAAYDAYVNTTEYNRLFSKEQTAFFKKEYQNSNFIMPTEVGAEMYITASFDHSIRIELAISEMEQKGIPKENICAIPMDVPKKEKKLMDTIHSADGLSMFDVSTALGTTFMLFGVMWGFMWTWGPIAWGLIGLFLGASLGFAFKYLYYRFNAEKQPTTGTITELMLIVSCHKSEAEMVERVLAGHLAQSIGRKE